VSSADHHSSTSPVHLLLLLLLAIALLWVALWRVALLWGVALLRGVTLLWGVAVLGVALCRVATWLQLKAAAGDCLSARMKHCLQALNDITNML
jgi:hypothetical protein